ncbi:ZIP family metal transporter [Hymenobacter sp. ISL-91]|uniref:ZIP family metal transporter n=1 Tax=Hymenobacter TaxID=89966 RepID=UPI0003A4FFB3|nr:MULTISPECIES: ZIP family metal transporter [Hymenobacter]MBT2557969.1 ZIP family metal transporter [Hymenobacter sp. ISL-91]
MPFLLSAAPAVTPSWSQVLLYALVPAAVMVVGAVIAVLRTPGAAIRSAILHFAAGVVFSVVAVELLPDIVARHRPLEVGLGFAIGVVVMLALRYFTRKAAKQEEAAPTPTRPSEGLPSSENEVDKAVAVSPATLPMGLLTGVGIDILIDGLLLGIGFAAGAEEGLLLAVALTIEVLSLGLATAVELRQQGQGKARSVGIVAALSALLVVGAGVGIAVLKGASDNVMELVLSFGLAALLFLVTEELLTEAHEEPESPWLTAMFFVGFLVFLLLGMVA